MKPKFVLTKNVKGFINLIHNLKNKPDNITKIGLVYGNAGLGKTKTALYLSIQYDAIYVRATNSMSPKWMLEEIAKELDEIPRFYTADIFRQCVNALKNNPQMIIVDEIDYLLKDFRTIETLRDLHDETGVPIILVGMQLAKHKLKKHTHLFDRISEIYNFTEFEYSDIKQIAEEISEVEITKEAIHIIHNKAKSFRQIVNTIDTFEKVAQANGLTQIDENIAQGYWVDKILKVAKKLKTFTLEDIVMFCEIDAEVTEEFLRESVNIKPCEDKFEYVETMKAADKFKIIDKNIPSKNSDITVTDACISFLNVSQIRNIKQNTVKAYKTFINAHIIPYFKGFVLKNITVSDVESFRKCMQNKQISERRIKNILTLLNQIIKHFQNEGYIDKTCIFEVKHVADIPKRQIQILTPEQLAQLFIILKKKYTYLLPIVQNLITLKQPLNNILTGSEQQKKSLKRKIRKDFYKIKQELGLTNYMFDDLRFSNFVK